MKRNLFLLFFLATLSGCCSRTTNLSRCDDVVNQFYLTLLSPEREVDPPNIFCCHVTTSSEKLKKNIKEAQWNYVYDNKDLFMFHGMNEEFPQNKERYFKLRRGYFFFNVEHDLDTEKKGGLYLVISGRVVSGDRGLFKEVSFPIEFCDDNALINLEGIKINGVFLNFDRSFERDDSMYKVFGFPERGELNYFKIVEDFDKEQGSQ